MDFVEYRTIDKKALDTFYRECGREVSLAYTVLNQTNTWAISFFGIVSGTGVSQLVAINKDSGTVAVVSPTIVHWALAIAAWCLMLRFFQRSILALDNMYRWNRLMASTLKSLLLPESKDTEVVLKSNNDQLLADINEFMIQWRAPRPPLEIIWASLKLMYLFPLVVLLLAVVYGAVELYDFRGYWYCFSLCVLWSGFELFSVLDWWRGGTRKPIGKPSEQWLDFFKK